MAYWFEKMWAIWKVGAFWALKGEEKVKKQNRVTIANLTKMFKSETWGIDFILL